VICDLSSGRGALETRPYRLEVVGRLGTGAARSFDQSVSAPDPGALQILFRSFVYLRVPLREARSSIPARDPRALQRRASDRFDLQFDLNLASERI